MKDTLLNKRNTLNVLLTFLGFTLLILCICLGIYDTILEQRAITRTGTISSLKFTNNKYKAEVSYIVDKEKYTQVINVGKDFTVNDQVKIKYDMYNPSKMIKNNHWIFIIVGIIISLILIKFNFKNAKKYLKNKNRINKLYNKGFYIKASITDVMYNNQGRKIKKQIPFKLRCKYLNPKDNKEYVFDSEDTYVNISDAINGYGRKDIIVVIDKNNSSNYYVDLGSLYPHMKLIDLKEFMAPKQEKKEEIKEEKEENKEENKEEKKEETNS